jgi:dTDP-glucose 4,6-dehydratase
MNILVTGSKGVVGTALVKQLIANGHTVFGIDLMHSLGEFGFNQQMSHENFTYSRCDVREFRQLERIVNWFRPNVVYNLAAEFGRWNGEDYYEKVWETNCVGLRHILTLQHRLKFELVQFSSAEVYGDYDGMITEDVMEKVEIRQMNDYAISKCANEMQVMNHMALHPDARIVRVRLFDIYGIGEIYHAYRGVAAKFIYHAIKGLPITVFKGHVRCGVYIDDTVRALATIADNFINGRVYNLGSDEPYTIEDMTQIIWDYAGQDWQLVEFVEAHEKATTRVKTCDSSAAKRDLGFKTTIGLEEGLKKTYDWMKNYEEKVRNA